MIKKIIRQLFPKKNPIRELQKKMPKNLVTGKKSILFFTTHKAASMFIYGIAGELSYLGGFRYYSINKHNLDEKDPNSWKEEDCCYAPLRFLSPAEKFLLPSIDKACLGKFNIILHLRDPRDVLVSMFFSHAYSHSRKLGGFNPSDEMRQKWIAGGIDRFILDEGRHGKSPAEGVLLRYELYCEHILNKPNVIFVKYEDMVSDFQKWLSQIIPPFNILNVREVIRVLMEEHKHAFKVGKENVMKHKRNIMPGDHKEKLEPGTINKLNLMFKDVLQELNYDT